MTRTNYKHKCCGNCEYFSLVWRGRCSNSMLTDYHVCEYRQERLIGDDDVYALFDMDTPYECYKPASKKHMKEMVKTMTEIIGRITEVNES